MSVSAIAVIFICVELGYEIGLRQAGFNRMDSGERLDLLEDELSAAEGDKKSLRERTAILETAANIDREAYAQVEKRLGELQGQVLELQEDLNFYQGIVATEELGGVRIQDVRVSEEADIEGYRIRLVLTQALRSNSKIGGRVDVHVEGEQDGKSVRHSLGDLSVDKNLKTPMKFGFRYFQDLRADLRLPGGFEPKRVIVKVVPDGKSAKTVEEYFDWDLNPG
jgi:hypothetical protein